MRRILGIIMIVIGLAGIGLSAVGLIAGWRLVDEIGAGLENNLTLTLESLETVRETLLLARDTIGQVNEGLATVEATADNVSLTLDATGPLLDQVSVVASQDVPESIEAFQSTLPALEDAAAAIDSAMRTLSRFGMDRSILGLQLDFGIDYDPEQPFDESIREIGSSLEGMPERLRSLEGNLNATEDALSAISGNMTDVADNLSEVNDNIDALEPLLDDYIATVTEIGDSTRQSRTFLREQLDLIKIVVSAIMIWLGLTQIAPLYLGWELLTGRGEDETVYVVDEDGE